MVHRYLSSDSDAHEVRLLAGRPRRASIRRIADVRVSSDDLWKTTQGVTMEYCELGHTGLRVSVVGYGTAPLDGMFGQMTRTQRFSRRTEPWTPVSTSSTAAPFYGVGLAEEATGQSG